MSELLDKQLNVQKESLKKTSGLHANSRKPTKKVCNENERKKQRKKKKRLPHQKNFCGRKDFIRLYQKTGSTDFDELQVIDSSNNEGTNSRVMGESGRKGWFVGRGSTNSTIKLAMAGT